MRLFWTLTLGPSVCIAAAVDEYLGIRCPVVEAWVKYLRLDRIRIKP